MRLLEFATKNIARRLFFTAATMSLLMLLIALVLLTQYYRRTAEDLFERRLKVYLNVLIQEVSLSAEEGRPGPYQLGDPQFDQLFSGWYWQVTPQRDANYPIATSRSLYASQLPKLSDFGFPADLGGSRHGAAPGPDGRMLRIVERVVHVGESGALLVQIAGPIEETEREIDIFRIALMVAFGALAIALAIATAIQVSFGLRPLRLLQSELAEVRRGAKERISLSYPSEIAPLAGELNLLISANREIVERARTQVGNLAHALKTPLSVLVNEADAAPSPLAEKVGAQAQVMRDQISFYLQRARAAARAGAIGATTQVEPVVAALLRTFTKIYAERGVSFTSDMRPGLVFLGERQDLEELIGNLVDNAGKWANGVVTIAVSAEPDASAVGRSWLVFLIDDDGSGLPPDQREEATKRGRRLDETKPGSGLGLSIVSDLAAAYGGSLSLDASPSGGLRARLRLPGF